MIHCTFLRLYILILAGTSLNKDQETRAFLLWILKALGHLKNNTQTVKCTTFLLIIEIISKIIHFLYNVNQLGEEQNNFIDGSSF